MNKKITSALCLASSLLLLQACGDSGNSTDEGNSSADASSSSENVVSSSSGASSSSQDASSSSETTTKAAYGPGSVKIAASGKTFSMGTDLDALYATATTSDAGALLKSLIMDNGTLEGKVHDVTLTYDFWMDSTEVTQAQVVAVLAASGETSLLSTIQNSWDLSHSTAHMPVGDQYPANISSPWLVAKYANLRSTLEGLTPVYAIDESAQTFTTNYSANGYRLPTEAEWEFAARAGSTTDFWWNKSYTMPLSASDSSLVSDYAVWKVNSGDVATTSTDYGPHVVASKLPNAFGLYDMSGNLSELVNGAWDWQEYDAAAVTDPQDASTLENDMDKVHKRGGNWMNHAMFLRSANRTYDYTAYKEFGVGFRLVRK